MNKILFYLVIIALLITACSSAKSTALNTPVASIEVQATGSEVMLEPTAEVADTSVLAETPSASRPADEIGEAVTDTAARGVDQPAATSTPSPTDTPYPTLRVEAQDEAYTPLPTATPTAVETAEETTAVEDEAATDIPEESIAETTIPADTLTETPAPSPAHTLPVSQASGAQSVELARIPDTDPAPPLTILVSAIRIEENGYYRLTGTVRNDGTETYGGIGVSATFYEEANPCSERQVTRRGRDGSEQTITVEDCDYNWHGPVKVYAACQLLEPGAQCPFSLEIYPEEYVSFLLHPEGTPVQYRQPASLALSKLNVHNNGLGYVRITGTATNANPFTVRDANIVGTLTAANGQIVSVGSIVVPGDIAPGASVSFDLRVEYEPYSNYQLNAQATQR